MKIKFLILVLFLKISILYSQDFPKGMPNGGIIGGNDWTINQYVEHAKTDSIWALNSKNRDLKVIENLKNEKLLKIQEARLGKRKTEEENTKILESYEKSLIDINAIFEKRLTGYRNYRDEWVNYLKAVKLKHEQYLAKEEADRKAEIIEKEEKEKIAQIESEKDRIKYQNIGNTAEYKSWKIKYLAILKSADGNKLIINNLETKHSFRNRLGHKVWDPKSLTKQEKQTYNNNLDAISKKLDIINELQAIGDNSIFLNYYENINLNDFVKGEELWNLSSYFNNHEKQY